MGVNILWVDVESYYDPKYSLRAMTPPQYVLDDRWEMQICAVAIDNEPPTIMIDAELRRFLQGINPDDTALVSHNMLFDGSVFAWRYGFIPARSFCTLSMSRALLGHRLRSLSLESVSAALAVGKKGTATLPRVKGLRLAEIIERGMYDEFCEYCLNDLTLCREIFKRLAPAFPAGQYRMLDLVIRCATQPRLMIDRERLTTYLTRIKADKAKLIESCGLDKSELMSAAKFQQELEKRGVYVETKTSGTGNEIPAFSKTDPFMAELQEHEDPEIQALANARLGVKSTLEEKRAEKMLAISALPWSQPSAFPIPLRYSGAHTHRLSGDWGINVQNLPRTTTGDSQLRRCVVAPPGCSIVVSDLGQIEARLAAWQAGATTLLVQFANKLDPYARLAESIFGYRVDRKIQVAEGFVGKSGILGLGYGLGKDNFYIKTIAAARGQKVELGNKFTQEIAERTVKTYRKDNREIPQFWYYLNGVLQSAFLGKSAAKQVGPVEVGHGYVALPDGLVLQYDNPVLLANDDGVRYTHPYGYWKKLWGGAFLENITQALAGQLIRDTWLRLDKLGYRAVWQVHDELVFVVPDTELEEAKHVIHAEMVRRPKWASDLPLSADVGSGKTYGDCK